MVTIVVIFDFTATHFFLFVQFLLGHHIGFRVYALPAVKSIEHRLDKPLRFHILAAFIEAFVLFLRYWKVTHTVLLFQYAMVPSLLLISVRYI